MATITKTIGSGGDYATIQAWANDLDNAAIYASGDAAVGQIIENKAFDEAVTITLGATIGLASRKLTVRAAERHTGTAGTGARIVKSGNGATNAPILSFDSDCNTTIEWLEVTTSGNWTRLIDATTANTARTHTVANCIAHTNGNPTSGNNYGIIFASASVVCTNNLVYSIKNSATGGGQSYGIAIGASTVPSVECHNNTVYNIVSDLGSGGAAGIGDNVSAIGGSHQDSSNKKYRNNVVAGVSGTSSGSKKCFDLPSSPASATIDHNASSDSTATGTGSLTSLVAGDNFSSIASSDFRPLNNSAPIYAAGVDLVTTPTGVNLDLKGRDRDAQNDTWSIGAYQLSAGGVVTNGIALTVPTAYRIYQRASGTATVTVSGTYTGTPTNIEVRVDSGSWATLQASPTAGVFSGTVSVAEGTHSLSVRFSNATDTTASVSNILVGDVFLIAGQSNADGRLTNAQSYTHASQKAAVFDPDDLGWRELIDPANLVASGGTPWPLTATQFLTDQGVAVGFIFAAEGGTAMSQWWTTSAQAKWTSAKARVTASGINALKAVLWDQGENDAVNDEAEATYNSRLDGLAGDVSSTYGCPLLVALSGTTTGIDADSDLDAIRSAQVTAWGDNANIKPGPVGYDRADLHWTTDAEGLTIAARWWLAMQSAFYSGSNGRGPRVSSASLNAARTQITVIFDRVLKTGLTFAAAAWSVDDDGSGATVSSVAYHGSNTSAVVLTLSTALSGALGTCEVTFASGNDAAGVVVPKSTDISMPSGSAVQLPAEPFYAELATEFVSPGDVEDLEDNPLAAISGFAVTNSSVQ